MLTEEQIKNEVCLWYTDESDEGFADFEDGFLKGAHWSNDQNSIEIAAKDAEIEELVEALFYLRNRVGQTEEAAVAVEELMKNVSGLHRDQWDRATAVLKKYGK